MKALDRALQRAILEKLADAYPDAVDKKHLPGHQAEARICIHYLEGHGLIRQWARDFDTDLASITPKGLDFLADDGGLGAVLNVVTVRLHADTVRDLLVGAVERSDTDESVKGKLVDRLKSMPADSFATVVEHTLKEGLARIPDLIGLLARLLQ